MGKSIQTAGYIYNGARTVLCTSSFIHETLISFKILKSFDSWSGSRTTERLPCQKNMKTMSDKAACWQKFDFTNKYIICQDDFKTYLIPLWIGIFSKGYTFSKWFILPSINPKCDNIFSWDSTCWIPVEYTFCPAWGSGGSHYFPFFLSFHFQINHDKNWIV